MEGDLKQSTEKILKILAGPFSLKLRRIILSQQRRSKGCLCKNAQLYILVFILYLGTSKFILAIPHNTPLFMGGRHKNLGDPMLRCQDMMKTKIYNCAFLPFCSNILKISVVSLSFE